MPDVVKVAIIQAEPVYYDLPRTLEKLQQLIHDAAGARAQLITIGETWLPGYPVWLDICSDMALWDHEPTKQVFARLYQNSLTIDGAEIAQLRDLAAQLRVVLVLGINERVEKAAGHGTLYNSIITINADGQLVNHHRKLMPTYTERIVWGQGDARGLQAVDTAVGRVGGLVCWEHWMPLTRQAMHESAEQVHIAAWPTVKEILQVASRHYAFEGRTFVLAAGSILRANQIPEELTLAENIKPDDLVQRGGSAIIAPDGEYLAGPVYDEETILTAELDLAHIMREQMTLDVTGHYARPDVFDFRVKRD